MVSAEQAATMFKEYFVIIILALVVLFLGIRRYIKSKREDRMKREIVDSMDRAKENYGEPTPRFLTKPATQEPDPVKEFEALFNPKSKVVKEAKDVMDDLKLVIDEMDKQSSDVENSLTGDIKALQEKVRDVSARKELIRQYGIQLAGLFETYQTRESQLKLMLTGLTTLRGQEVEKQTHMGRPKKLR